MKNKFRMSPAVRNTLILLIILVLLAAVVLSLRLVLFAVRENRRVIELTPSVAAAESLSAHGSGSLHAGSGSNPVRLDPTNRAPVPGSSATTTTSGGASGTTARTPYASFHVEDDKQVWTTNTQIDVFRDTWANGQGEITVKSEDGDRVIAPGTGSEYSFVLRNTGDAEVRYQMDLKSFFEEGSDYVPVKVRLRSGNNWLVGDPDNWEDPARLVEYSESGTMVGRASKSFTFEWAWPYEKGEDEALAARDAQDTGLGNEAVAEDIRFTLLINTYAESDGGHDNPKTGDSANPLLYLVLTAAAAAGRRACASRSGARVWRPCCAKRWALSA